MDSREALVALNMIEGVGPVRAAPHFPNDGGRPLSVEVPVIRQVLKQLAKTGVHKKPLLKENGSQNCAVK
jgi:hypothetical protein